MQQVEDPSGDLGTSGLDVVPRRGRHGYDRGDGVRTLFDDLDAVVPLDDRAEVRDQRGLRIGDERRPGLGVVDQLPVLLGEAVAAHRLRPPSRR